MLLDVEHYVTSFTVRLWFWSSSVVMIMILVEPLDIIGGLHGQNNLIFYVSTSFITVVVEEKIHFPGLVNFLEETWNRNTMCELNIAEVLFNLDELLMLLGSWSTIGKKSDFVVGFWMYFDLFIVCYSCVYGWTKISACTIKVARPKLSCLDSSLTMPYSDVFLISVALWIHRLSLRET